MAEIPLFPAVFKAVFEMLAIGIAVQATEYLCLEESGERVNVGVVVSLCRLFR